VPSREKCFADEASLVTWGDGGKVSQAETSPLGGGTKNGRRTGTQMDDMGESSRKKKKKCVTAVGNHTSSAVNP